MQSNLSKRPILPTAVLFGVVLSSGALAGIPERVAQPIRIRTRAEAEQLPVGSKVTLACAKCKTTLLTQVDQKKSFLFWFAPKTLHECPGCGGKIRFEEFGNPAKSLYTHTCSICGNNSVACWASAPGHATQ